jgi:hypothetical protein
MTPQTMLDEKKALPFGQVKLDFCSEEQTSGMFPNTQFIVATWTNTDQIMATTWAVKVVLGGTFI